MTTLLVRVLFCRKPFRKLYNTDIYLLQFSSQTKKLFLFIFYEQYGIRGIQRISEPFRDLCRLQCLLFPSA